MKPQIGFREVEEDIAALESSKKELEKSLENKQKTSEEICKDENLSNVDKATQHLYHNQTMCAVRVEIAKIDAKIYQHKELIEFYNSLSEQGKETFNIVVFLRRRELTFNFLDKI